MAKTVHIIGAGLSGLSAAVRLANAGHVIHVHEATQQAGGRCRSYFDSLTQLTIDNGNHLLLSGNHHALAYARSIGTEAGLVGPERAQFPFIDLQTGKRWTLDLGNGRIPTWLFDKSRRVPDTSVSDYLKLAPLIWASPDKLVGDAIPCAGTLYHRLVQPLLLAALNVDPPEGSAGLAGAIVRETLLAGGQSCRPLIARAGLSDVLVEPAIEMLRARGAGIHFGHELRGATMAGDRVATLNFGADDSIALGPDDAVVMAATPRVAASILPGLTAPTKFRAIVNAHFRYEPPAGLPALTGVVGGLIEWLFAFPQRLSITISGADRLIEMPREELARTIWRDICQTAGIDIATELPPWQIVRERRATFEATPEQNKLRPGPVTAFKNLFLAGDWTDTGLPATIEGSVRSGDRAADLVLAMRQA
jgi:squalene-associated FAD-dependent desaturase